MKQYIKNLLKKYIPFYAVSFAIIISMFLIFVSVSPNYITDYYSAQGYAYRFSGKFSFLLLFIIPLAILTTVAPLFANSYRYSLKSVDVFYQTGKGDKKIRYANNLTLLISLLAIYTVAFMVAMILLAIKQLPFAGQVINDTAGGEVVITKTYFAYNFGYYILAYLLAVICCCVNYFISYFLVTRSNNLLNSMIILLLGQGILSIIIMTPIWYVDIVKSAFGIDVYYRIEFLPGTRLASIIGPYAILGNFFESLICESIYVVDFKDIYIFDLVLTIISNVAFFAVGGLSIFAFLKEKESSGEFAGKPIGRGPYQNIVFHLAAGLIGLWGGAATGIAGTILLTAISNISGFITFGALYYVFLGLLNRNFRLKIKDLIIMLSVDGVYLISMIFMIVLRHTLY